MGLLEEAIAAHGGLERWREIDSIDISLRVGGIAMPTKGQPTITRNFSASADTHRPHVELHGIGTFDGDQPRPPGMARRMRWNTADAVHFTGYALWGYLTAPFLFAEQDLRVPSFRAGACASSSPDGSPPTAPFRLSTSTSRPC